MRNTTINLYDFNPAEWISRFPLWENDLDVWTRLAIIDPCSLAHFIQLRSRITSQAPLGSSVEADTFVFGLGEAENRDATKIGGVPYRPSAAPWPINLDGDPLTFLAQFRFADSKDLFDVDLPGDVLLIFVIDDDICSDLGSSFFRFEWHPLGLDNLIAPEDVPNSDWNFVTCYGLRYRTVDFAEERAEEIVRDLIPRQLHSRISVDVVARRFCHVDAIKIGGIPFVQDCEDQEEIDEEDYGTFLCSIRTIWPSEETPYPWVNHPAPLQWGETHDKNMYLQLRDGFALHFFIDDDKNIGWFIEFR